VAIALDEVARRLRQEEHAHHQDERPGELDSNGNAVGACVVAVGGGVVDDGGEEEANRDGELVAADDDTADPFRCCLGLVERD
jgi:hypothetical protein